MKFNLKLKNKIQPVVEAPSFKLQASSLTTDPGPCRMNLERRNI